MKVKNEESDTVDSEEDHKDGQRRSGRLAKSRTRIKKNPINSRRLMRKITLKLVKKERKF